MKTYIAPILITALIVGGLSFYGGMQYQQSSQNALRSQRMQQFGTMGGQGGPGAFGDFSGSNLTGSQGRTAQGGLISGEIINLDEKSITVRTRDGGSKIIFFSDSTSIVKTVDGLATDLASGKNVSIMGTTNSDGSVTAQNIQVRPTATTSMTNVGNMTQTNTSSTQATQSAAAKN